MTLIHTALLCEAQSIIERLRLQKVAKNRYENDNFILIISGIGAKNTKLSLEEIFSTCKFEYAINIGIAGCKDKDVPIGELFCTNKQILHAKNATITSVDKPTKDINTTLVDMEAAEFELTCKRFGVECLVLKVVSDHLDDKIPKKDFVINLIRKSLDKWINLI
ncbi:MAG: nucleoside phosphorylase [Campylobacteraceae bacterium]|nr:nucleoside phosphorylase [Campylobacteraceae bacterium]